MARKKPACLAKPALRLDQNSTITLGGLRQERTSIIELLTGALYFFSRLPRWVVGMEACGRRTIGRASCVRLATRYG